MSSSNLLAMRKSLSLASVSTRASSSDSLATLCAESDKSSRTDTQTQITAHKQPSRRRRLVLMTAVCVVTAWAWSRFIGKITRSTRTWAAPGVAAKLLAVLGMTLGVSGRVCGGAHAALPNAAPRRQALVGLHPHGLYLMGPFFVIAKELAKRSSPWYGLFVGGADAVFAVPGLRELAVLLRGRVASARTIDGLLSAGHSVALFPGGIHEQLATDSTQEQLFFPPNLGFIRQAIKHGVPLQPAYTFGENQLFDVPPSTRALGELIKKYTGAGVPLGVGRWGLPFIPKKQPLQVNLGRPIEVGAADSSPSDDQVRSVFRAYCAELHCLFNKHKNEALPAVVAARGLQITWRGHADEDLSEEALLGGAVNDGLKNLSPSSMGKLTRTKTATTGLTSMPSRL